MGVKLEGLHDLRVPRVQIYDLMVYLVVLVKLGFRLLPLGYGLSLIHLGKVLMGKVGNFILLEAFPV